MCGCGGCSSIQQAYIKGDPGDPGDSAYQVAVQNGFVGTITEWLLSLNGDNGQSAYEVAVANGFVGDQPAWLASLVGQSAYALAVSQGFVGNEAAWIASLAGANGKNAYTLTNGAFVMPAVNATTGVTFVNAAWTVVGQWVAIAGAGYMVVASLPIGNTVAMLNPATTDFPAGLPDNAAPGTNIISGTPTSPGGIPGHKGADGVGTPGLSAYAVAQANGFVGSQSAWLASLVGAAGAPGAQIYSLGSDPNGQASSYGAPNNSLVIRTDPGFGGWIYQRSAPGVWNLIYSPPGVSPADADVFKVAKSITQAIPTGTVVPTVVQFENSSPPYINNGAWNGARYLASGSPPSPQTFTIENFTISRAAGPGQALTFTVDLMQDTGGGGVSIGNVVLTMLVGDTTKSFIILTKPGVVVPAGSTVYVQVTPSVNPTIPWSIATGSFFYNTAVAPV